MTVLPMIVRVVDAHDLAPVEQLERDVRLVVASALD